MHRHPAGAGVDLEALKLWCRTAEGHRFVMWRDCRPYRLEDGSYRAIPRRDLRFLEQSIARDRLSASGEPVELDADDERVTA